MTALHHPGYDDIEQHVSVEEIQQAKCQICTWEGEQHDGLNWQLAEQDAVEHFEEVHLARCDDCGRTFDPDDFDALDEHQQEEHAEEYAT